MLDCDIRMPGSFVYLLLGLIFSIGGRFYWYQLATDYNDLVMDQFREC